MKICGVDFAPLNTPINRRLQTFGVFTWGIIFLSLGPLVLLTLYLLLYTSFWPLTLAYVAWYIYDLDTCNRGARRNQWLRQLRIWKYYAQYFPVKLIKTAELDPERQGNYLLGSHPHGILCSGTFAAFATEGCEWAKVFPGVVPNLLTLEGFHQMPGFREILSFSGTCAATSKSMDYLLSKPKGRAVILVVGGAREVLCQDQDRIDLIILNRKGFIKKALKHGSALVPTFSFGEAFIYGKLFPNPRGSWIRSFQEYIVDKTRWPFPFFSGRGIFQYSFGMLPRRYPITVVIGEPILVNQVADPTSQEIDELHDKYLVALRELYDKHNPIYGDPKVQLNYL
eukprot:12500.XXX_852786_853986_1 [CDS] Oithona nana genome sequencing.